MDFYKVLELQPSATKREVKAAYKKLAKKYHPDKNKNQDAIDKFRDVQSAYEILYDDSKRTNYDNMKYAQRTELYDTLKGYFIKKAPNCASVYEALVEKLYGDEDDLKTDINNLDLHKIYNKIYNAIVHPHSNYNSNSNKVKKHLVK